MARMGPRMGPTVGPRMGPNITFGGGTAPLSLLLTAHGLSTGDGPFTLTTTGVLPTGLATATDYYAIVVDTDHLLLAASRADALASTEIVLTDAGSGTHTLVTGAAYSATSLTFSDTFTTSYGDDPYLLQFAGDTGLSQLDGPLRVTTTGSLPPGLATGTDYWIGHDQGDTHCLSPSFADAAIDNYTGWVDLIADGTGTHTLTAQPGALHYTPVALGDSTFTVE